MDHATVTETTKSFCCVFVAASVKEVLIQNHLMFPNLLSTRVSMLSDLQLLSFFVGYTNASWTLKSDLPVNIFLGSEVFDKHNYKAVQAKSNRENLKPSPLLNLNSGYITRSANTLPSQGNSPWRIYQNYILDYKMLRLDPLKQRPRFF
jgi:hypothetical protein